jgi:spore maturation protein CgeB
LRFSTQYDKLDLLKAEMRQGNGEDKAMTVLIYRYGSICEPDIIDSFQKQNVDIKEISDEITDKSISSAQRVMLVRNAIDTCHPLFVFSINFFPAIAEVCHIYRLPYICWTVDVPVLELFSKSIQYDTNRIFLFDRAQYEDFHPFNPDCIFYLPLASAVERFDCTIRSASADDNEKFSCDISFVGSLYSEKNLLNSIKLPKYIRGFIDGIVEASLKVYGCNFIEDALSDECVSAIRENSDKFYTAADSIVDSDRYVAAHYYIGMQAAEKERIRTLNALAEHFQVDLFTRSDTSPLKNVRVHGGVKTLTEMPLIFHQSRINLNMTIKPIQTGLPLRIFDIMGCGGFLMTNYQEELTDYFEIGTDLEAYGSMEELLEKCAFYLEHEDLRRQIAQNGYEKVKKYHTYPARLAELLRKVV